MSNDEIREKIFNGNLDENDFSDEEVRSILNLIQDKDNNRRPHHGPLVVLEWEMIVKKLRKIALIHIFS